MPSILFLIETIYSNILRSNYLRNEKYLLYFFVFPKFRFNSESFLKKLPLIAEVFLNLRTGKEVVR